MSLSNYTVYRWKGGCPDHEEADNWGGIWRLKAYPVLLWCQHLHHRHRPTAEARLWVPWVVVVTATWSSTTRPQWAWPWGSQLLAPITKNGHETKQQTHESQQAEKEMTFLSFALSFSPLPPPPFRPLHTPWLCSLTVQNGMWYCYRFWMKLMNESMWMNVRALNTENVNQTFSCVMLECHCQSIHVLICSLVCLFLFSLCLSLSLSLPLYTWEDIWEGYIYTCQMKLR